jgi:hypothetical protein
MKVHDGMFSVESYLHILTGTVTFDCFKVAATEMSSTSALREAGYRFSLNCALVANASIITNIVGLFPRLFLPPIVVKMFLITELPTMQPVPEKPEKFYVLFMTQSFRFIDTEGVDSYRQSQP